jgi:probable addiction module antidote protein
MVNTVTENNAEPVTFAKWDSAEYLNSKEDIIVSLSLALEAGDTEYLLKIMGDIARSEGMTRIARELGLSREGLYRSIAPNGNPSFETVIKLLDLLGFRLKIERKSA